MEAFEQIVARVFDRQGYWIKQSYKVDVTKEEKRLIGTPDMPRVEIDLLAFRPNENVVHVIECKSYLDSRPIAIDCFKAGQKRAARFKLFNDSNRRAIVFEALQRQLVADSICREGVTLRLGLVAGNVHPSHRLDLKALFELAGWDLWDDIWVAQKLRDFSSGLYENSLVDITAKLIERTVRPEDKLC
jgi:hypothetical protein